MFVDDVNVSKGMVKYATAIPRESIVDVEGELETPEAPIEACSQSQVGSGALRVCRLGFQVWRPSSSCLDAAVWGT